MPQRQLYSEGGEPLTVYHGTRSDISIENFMFRADLIGSNTDAGHYGQGFYFARSPGEASYYGPNILAAQLAIENPLLLDNTSGDLTFSGHFKSWAPKLDAIGALQEDQKEALDAMLAADGYVREHVRFGIAVAHDGTEGWIAKVKNPAPGFSDDITTSPLFGRHWAKTTEEALEQLLHKFRSEMERFHREMYPGLGQEHASLSDYVRTQLGAVELTRLAREAGHDAIVYGDEFIIFDAESIRRVPFAPKQLESDEGFEVITPCP